jgi:dTDP-4-dehydrorhamnose reductase
MAVILVTGADGQLGNELKVFTDTILSLQILRVLTLQMLYKLVSFFKSQNPTG